MSLGFQSKAVIENAARYSMIWTLRIKVPHAAIAVILAYAMGAGTVYAVSKKSQRQESLQTQKVEQIVCP